MRRAPRKPAQISRSRLSRPERWRAWRCLRRTALNATALMRRGRSRDRRSSTGCTNRTITPTLRFSAPQNLAFGRITGALVTCRRSKAYRALKSETSFATCANSSKRTVFSEKSAFWKPQQYPVRLRRLPQSAKKRPASTFQSDHGSRVPLPVKIISSSRPMARIRPERPGTWLSWRFVIAQSTYGMSWLDWWVSGK